MERLLTCNGGAPFGHCGAVSLAVKHLHVRNPNGFDDFTSEGMVYVTFVSREVASMFQSYWRNRKMTSRLEVTDAFRRIVVTEQFRLVQVGTCKVIERTNSHIVDRTNS